MTKFSLVVKCSCVNKHFQNTNTLQKDIVAVYRGKINFYSEFTLRRSNHNAIFIQHHRNRMMKTLIYNV